MGYYNVGTRINIKRKHQLDAVLETVTFGVLILACFTLLLA